MDYKEPKATALQVTLHSGRELVDQEWFGKTSPYVKMFLGKIKKKSEKKKGSSAVWEQSFNFTYNDEPHLRVQVWDKDMFSDDYMGTTDLPLAQILQKADRKFHGEIPLTHKKGRPAGYLKLTIQFWPLPQDPKTEDETPAPAAVAAPVAAPAQQPQPQPVAGAVAPQVPPYYHPVAAGQPVVAVPFQQQQPQQPSTVVVVQGGPSQPQRPSYPPAAYGSPYGYSQPGYPPAAYAPQPPQGYPPAGYSPQAYPPQQQGYPPQGYPPAGYSPQAYPPQQQGYPPAGYPPQGYPPQGYYR